ncbi:hypothetical protein TRIUR3_27422 [Triticum urartu]|uniref:Uncharacterized protein n=2 Tax=Triticum TaxID=4564 RepID=M8ASI8_TRIUA|nr:hypothetical protein TRIUR3_27422 [Triticum urartu]
MAGGGIFSRALSYVVNEFLVEGLANNRAFQRFAVRTNRTLEDLSSKAKQAREEISEQFKDARGPNDLLFEMPQKSRRSELSLPKGTNSSGETLLGWTSVLQISMLDVVL